MIAHSTLSSQGPVHGLSLHRRRTTSDHAQRLDSSSTEAALQTADAQAFVLCMCGILEDMASLASQAWGCIANSRSPISLHIFSLLSLKLSCLSLLLLHLNPSPLSWERVRRVDALPLHRALAVPSTWPPRFLAAFEPHLAGTLQVGARAPPYVCIVSP